MRSICAGYVPVAAAFAMRTYAQHLGGVRAKLRLPLQCAHMCDAPWFALHVAAAGAYGCALQSADATGAAPRRAARMGAQWTAGSNQRVGSATNQTPTAGALLSFR